jgi:hypothetical protein
MASVARRTRLDFAVYIHCLSLKINIEEQNVNKEDTDAHV